MSATGRGAVRRKNDFYSTPRDAFLPLLPFLPLHVSIWEPAKGDGRLIEMMREYGLDADGADLMGGYDFLKDNRYRDCLLTNPPFSSAFEFCQHAVEISSCIFLLLRLNFLASRKRFNWWRQHEPSALFVLSKRPSFDGIGTDATDYAWFYWGSIWTGIYHLGEPVE